MKNLLAFLFGWLIAAVFMIPQARAAVTVSPVLAGYSASAGRFASSASGFSMTAANDGYIAQAVTNVGGRPITMPATMRMAANAGQIAKNAMRLSPAGIIGTLAAGWLLEQGMDYVNGEWVVNDTSGGTYEGGVSWRNAWPQGDTMSTQQGTITNTCGVGAYCTTEGAAVYAAYKNTGSYSAGSPYDIVCSGGVCTYKQYRGSPYNSVLSSSVSIQSTGQPAPSTTRPATQDDWDALADPLPAVAPELPYAPYMPDGAPVTAPEYAPQNVPVGDPYTRADGSTAQPMARISPAGNGQVTIDTYDQPLTDPAGNPVTDPQPSDTTESVDPCESNPGRLGCAEFGTAEPVEVPTTEIPVDPTVTPIGGLGQCPADVVTPVFGITWSYQPVCDFAADIRPLIIGFAWLAFAYIVAGTIRT